LAASYIFCKRDSVAFTSRGVKGIDRNVIRACYWFTCAVSRGVDWVVITCNAESRKTHYLLHPLVSA